MARTKSLSVDRIRIDGETQPRNAIDNQVVADYADAIKPGAAFPHVVVFYDGVHYWLADGFHRWHAHRRAERDRITCEVHNGSCDDAKWFSVAANQTHGLRRTNADKEKAVKAALQHPKGAELSDRQIAEYVGVSNTFVGKVRSQLSTVDSSSARTGKDGKKRKLPKKKPATKTAPEPGPEPEQGEEDGDVASDDEPDPEQQQQVADNEAFVVIEATIRYQFSGRLAVAAARLEALAEKLRSEL
jgi:ParB-like chromosome segregation protein Spo0J